MKLFNRFISWCARHFITDNITEEDEKKVDPFSFTAEEIAKPFGMSVWMTRICCDTAVRQGKFERLDDIHYRLITNEGRQKEVKGL